MKLRFLPLVACALLPACVTTPPVAPNVKLDTQVTSQCAQHCQTLGMQLSAVVIIMSSTGCVCEPAPVEDRNARTGAQEGPSAAVSGAAIQAVLAAQEEQRRQSQQSAQSSQGWQPGATPGGSYHSPGAWH